MLGEKETFLLHYLHHRKLEWKIDDPVKSLFSNYQNTISDLKKDGYLKDDDHSFFLEEMTIPDLKKILIDKSLTTSGKKKDLIKRILENTSSKERASICSDQYYVLTEKGLEINKIYCEKQKLQDLELKEYIANIIAAGKYTLASIEKAKAYSQYVIPPGIGIDWSNIEQVIISSEKNQLHVRQFDFSDLRNSASFKETLFKMLYYDIEIEHNLFKSITKYMHLCNEILDCPDLECFFQRRCYNPIESEKIFVYLDRKRYNALQVHMNNLCQDKKYTALPKGIFHISDQTIAAWKKEQEDREEFNCLSELGIEKFPKTFRTFQSHKNKNDEKYKFWIGFLKN